MDTTSPEAVGMRVITQAEYNDMRAHGTASESPFGFLLAEPCGNKKVAKIGWQTQHRAFFDFGDLWFETVEPLTPKEFQDTKPWVMLKDNDTRRELYTRKRVA